MDRELLVEHARPRKSRGNNESQGESACDGWRSGTKGEVGTVGERGSRRRLRCGALRELQRYRDNGGRPAGGQQRGKIQAVAANLVNLERLRVGVGTRRRG